MQARPDFASMNVSLQAALAAHCRGNYGLALALVAGLVAVAIVVLTALGTEARGAAFGKAPTVCHPRTHMDGRS